MLSAWLPLAIQAGPQSRQVGQRTARAESKTLEEQVLETMKTATRYMMDVVSYRGGFVWNYLPDLSRQWGEMETRRTMVWNQAPGTPQMGHLLLDAYHATGDEYYYDAAMKVAQALIWGQQDNGGWNYTFDFAGEESLKEWYATTGRSGWRLEEFQHYYGNATFDDGCTTQCARYLLRIYLEKRDLSLRKALDKAIGFVLNSQYPNGGWPQRWPLMYDHPFRGKADYSSFITLNDDVMPECVDFLIECYRTLGQPELKEPIFRAMYLCIRLQQEAPYAGWADQYTATDLKPAHARSYEPRSVNTGTTERMIHLMMDYYRLTGDTCFLSGIPAALVFLESQKLPASEEARWGRMFNDSETILVPRFIDPDTGEPLYVHRVGSNVFNGHYYTSGDISGTIGHYSSARRLNVGMLRKQYENLKARPVAEVVEGSPLLEGKTSRLPRYYTAGRSRERVGDIIAALSPEGYWLSPLGSTSNPYKPGASDTPSDETRFASTDVGDEYDTSPYRCTDGSMCISTRDFIGKMTTLIRFIASSENDRRSGF
ncbi:MAG: pectate lyase [Bacteroidales bacterium]|nr:pectate lyase [Bacteroidales bacterium]